MPENANNKAAPVTICSVYAHMLPPWHRGRNYPKGFTVAFRGRVYLARLASGPQVDKAGPRRPNDLRDGFWQDVTASAAC